MWDTQMDGLSVRPRADRDAELGPVVIARDRIAARVGTLADEIAACYGQAELTVLVVLTGAVVFVADLVRRLPMRVRQEAVRVRSYPGRATRSQGPTFLLPPSADLVGRDVLIVDDILDSGRTLAALGKAVSARRPASLRTCVLLQKRRADLPGRPRADFVGFEIGDEFVVGYGLDYDNRYRDLPDIRVLAGARSEEDA
jgi:hypoxanthine phosphoribosyltransferase